MIVKKKKKIHAIQYNKFLLAGDRCALLTTSSPNDLDFHLHSLLKSP